MTQVNKKIAAIMLAIILALFIGISVFIYVQNQKESQQQATFTIIGTLTYAPGHAIYRGISITNITPSVSPNPTNLTFTEANGVNYTVSSFVYLNFSNKFTFPTNGFAIDYPIGFAQGDRVKISGEMSFNPTYQGYFMNVTSIVHYTS